MKTLVHIFQSRANYLTLPRNTTEIHNTLFVHRQFPTKRVWLAAPNLCLCPNHSPEIHRNITLAEKRKRIWFWLRDSCYEPRNSPIHNCNFICLPFWQAWWISWKWLLAQKNCFPDGCQQTAMLGYLCWWISKNPTFLHIIFAPFFINDVTLVPLTGCTPKKSHYPDFG